MNIAIIGGTKAVGSGIINAALKRNDKVFVFARKDSPRINRLKEKNIVLIECDLDGMKTFDCAHLPKMDMFFFLAWEATYGEEARNDMYRQSRNIIYSIDAVNLAYRMGCSTFVGTGSQAEYGRVDEIITPYTSCNPENGYGIAKLCAGKMTNIECQKLNIKHVWCRILSVFGPDDNENTMVSSTIINGLKGKSLFFSPGEQIWDYMYQDDAGEAIYLAGLNGMNSSVYVVASGHSRRLKDFIDVICSKLGDCKPIYGKIDYSHNQVMRLEADISKLKQETGFKGQYTFEEGIDITIDEIRKRVLG